MYSNSIALDNCGKFAQLVREQAPDLRGCTVLVPTDDAFLGDDDAFEDDCWGVHVIDGPWKMGDMAVAGRVLGRHVDTRHGIRTQSPAGRALRGVAGYGPQSTETSVGIGDGPAVKMGRCSMVDGILHRTLRAIFAWMRAFLDRRRGIGRAAAAQSQTRGKSTLPPALLVGVARPADALSRNGDVANTSASSRPVKDVPSPPPPTTRGD